MSFEDAERWNWGMTLVLAWLRQALAGFGRKNRGSLHSTQSGTRVVPRAWFRNRARREGALLVSLTREMVDWMPD